MEKPTSLRNAGNRLLENVIGNAKGVGKGDFLIRNILQPLVGDDDQGVYLILQLCDALVGLGHAARALKAEGLGDNADGQDASFTGQVSDDGRRAGASAAAHTGG